MQFFHGALFICWAVAGSGSLIRRKADNEPQWKANNEAGIDSSQWSALDLIDQMDRDLVRMSSTLGGVRSFLQVDSADSPASTKQGKSKSIAASAVKSATKLASSVQQKGTNQKQETKPFDAQTVVVQMESMDKLGKARLPAMLGLMTEMYDGWKQKIGVANKNEKEQKKDFDATIRDLEIKKSKNSGLSKDDKTYDKIEKYWSLQRKIAHRQYHTVLKIAHAGMEKFKTVIHAMQSAIDSKKPDPSTMKKIQSMEMPEVVLLQKVESLTHWAHDTISLLRDAKKSHD